MNHVMGGGLDIYWRWRLVASCAAQRPARILDLATGSGDVLLALRGIVPLRSSRRRRFLPADAAARAGQGGEESARRRRPASPFPVRAFDAVTIAWGLRNFDDRLAGLREMRRVLRPGGRAYVLEFSHPLAWLAPLYFWYMRDLMPKYARFFTPERGAYEYLGDSIRAFPRQPVLARMMRDAGFSAARWANFALGIVALHTADV